MSSAVAAQSYVKRMIERESAGWGDMTPAIERLERKYGIPFWTINNIRTGRAKTIEAGIFARIKAAYIDMCERQIARLQHELEIERELDGDALDSDLLAQVQGLAAKVQKAKRKG
ncbi:hypothetical protein [Rhizobium sp. J15]|uniref:hypothetical protein n=1 Tax=Rhizobium sp. J15 TaxID=2035450 RepID=UPI001FDEE4F2|nr:hypothetical protein [Rhizobium sp. J15]